MPTNADFIRCRTYGHGWEEFSPTNMARPLFGFRLSLQCIRCTTTRHDLIDQNGEVGQREYRYPEGYKYATAAKPSKAEFRMLLLQEQKRERRNRKKAG